MPKTELQEKRQLTHFAALGIPHLYCLGKVELSAHGKPAIGQQGEPFVPALDSVAGLNNPHAVFLAGIKIGVIVYAKRVYSKRAVSFRAAVIDVISP